MKYKMHLNSRMFLKNPYVVRVKHPESIMGNLDLGKFRQTLRVAKLMIRDTWGYSSPEFEITKTNESSIVAVNGQPGFSWSMPVYECHSYWVFSNETDALQFRLTIGDNATQVHMWAHNIKFTITEYFEDADET